MREARAGAGIDAIAQDLRSAVRLLRRNPLFAQFVELAASPNQRPTPAIMGAQYLQDEVIRAAEDALYKLTPPAEALQAAQRRVQARREAERE